MGIDGQYDADGARIQPHFRRTSLMRGSPRPGGDSNPVLGLVIKIHHKDYDTNGYGAQAEYDVLIANSLMTLTNVVWSSWKNNRESGDEATLTAATDSPDLSNPENIQREFLESDGDLVLVDFVKGFGNTRFPIIVGTMNHLKSDEDTAPWHGESSDGIRRAIHHKGTSIVFEDDSTLDISIPDEKELTILIDGIQLFRVHRDSGGSGSVVELGTGAEKMLLAETFQTWWDSYVKNHTHAAGTLLDSTASPCSGNTAPAVGSFPTSALSDVSKNE